MILLWCTWSGMALVLLAFGLRGAFRAWLDRKRSEAAQDAYIAGLHEGGAHDEKQRRIARRERLFNR